MPVQRPKVVLFDIGGVCVISPFQAILDYEKRQSIPLGYINHAISASSPNGSWQRLERGEIPLDAHFFRLFHADLTNEKVWRAYSLKAHAAAAKKEAKRNGSEDARAKQGSEEEKGVVATAAEETLFNGPPSPPDIDAEWLYWEMMRISRHPDPHMYPALKRLRQHADTLLSQQRQQKGGGGGEKREEGQQPFLIAALSNTSIFPADHEFSRQDTPEGKFNRELKGLFDVFVSSAHVGMRKPNRDIYEHTILQLDDLAKSRTRGIFENSNRDDDAASASASGSEIEAGDVVFLDDIGGNLRTAREVGMRTIKVMLGRADLAVKELEAVMRLNLSSGPSVAKL